MIRDEKYITETCPRCKRPDWTHKERYSLLTEAEQMRDRCTVKNVKGAPRNAERCSAIPGSDISSAVEEAKELSGLMQKEVAFDFNNVTVIVNAFSDVEEICKKWKDGLEGF